MKLYTKEITNCLACPNREQEDEMNADGSNWIMVHTCLITNRVITRIDMHLVNKENLEEMHLYKMDWFPDWCPLTDVTELLEE